MAWEDAKPILRPDGVHMGIMQVNKEACISCGLCMENCPFRAWELDEDEYPKMKDEYECFSCYNCKVACPEGAIEIIEPYHVDDGFWATDPHPLPAKMPLSPMDAQGNPATFNAIEQAVFERRSVRNFKEDLVPDALIKRVLEAGRFAPSAGNCQPWKFIVVTDKNLIKEMDDAVWGVIDGFYNMYNNDDAVKGLESMAVGNPNPGMFDPRLALGGMGAISKKHGPPLLNAPAVIIIAADNRAIGSPELNVGICGQNMNLVANSLGIKACWVGFITTLQMVPGFTEEKLGIKPPWQIVTALVLGWPRFQQEGIVPREYRPVNWYREGANKPDIED